MERADRRFHVQAAVGQGLRGALAGTAFGLALGGLELALSLLAGEWPLTAEPGARALRYALVGLVLGAFLGPSALLVDDLLRRLGRRRPAAGLALPAILGTGTALYSTLIQWATGAPWRFGSTRLFLVALAATAVLGTLATWPLRLRPPRDGWTGVPRALEAVLVAVLALGAVTWWAVRAGEIPLRGGGFPAWAAGLLAYPAALMAALALEGVLLRLAARAGRWLRPAPAAALAVAALGLASVPGGTREATARTNAVVVVIDGARADSVSATTQVINPTPGFDAVAAAGTLFLAARSPSPWCLPGHVALLHGAVASRFHLTELSLGELRPERRGVAEPPSLAERLQRQGYATAAISRNPWVGPLTGLDRGFERFWDPVTVANSALRLDDLVRQAMVSSWASDGGARSAVDAGLKWLGEPRSRPAFLFLNLSSPMPPWTPTEPWLGKAIQAMPYLQTLPPGKRRTVFRAAENPLAFSLSPVEIDWREWDTLRAFYQAEVAAADAALEHLVAVLAERDLLRHTLLVVTSDHGQIIDQGTRTLGNIGTLAEGVLRVPLAMRGPGVPIGARVEEPVSLLDVVPTVLESLGVEPAATLEGRSLLGLARGEDPARTGFADRPLHAEHRSPRFHLDLIHTLVPDAALEMFDRDQFAVIRGGNKLRVDSTGRRTAHDLTIDPEEGNPAWMRSDQGRMEVERLEAELSAWLAAHPLPAERGPEMLAAHQRVLAAIPPAWR